MVPSSDYIGHPFPQRHNQIFERLNKFLDFEVHVVRYNFFSETKQDTALITHELTGSSWGSIANYYLLNVFSHASQIRRLVQNQNIDIIVLSNLAAPFLFTILDELSSLNIPIVVDLPDYYPTSASGNLFDFTSLPGRILSNTFDLMLRRIVKHATLVTVVSQALKTYALQAGAQWVELVPNGVGKNFLESHDARELRKKLGFMPDDLVIGYIGSIEFWLEMKTLFRGVALALKNNVNAKLLLVGRSLHTGYMAKIKKQLINEDIEHCVTWLDFVPYTDVPLYMKVLDVGTIPFDVHNPTAYYSSPNKMWEYLSQQIPVISTPIPEAINNAAYLSIVTNPQDYSSIFSNLWLKDKFLYEKTHKGFLECNNRTWEKSAEYLAFLFRQLLLNHGRN